MKTVKGLHEKMGTFENANTSFHQAARCKRYTNEVLAFSMIKNLDIVPCNYFMELAELEIKGNIRYLRCLSQKNGLLWRCRSMIEWCNT